MTIHAMERVLWLIGNEPGQAARFNADPDAFLQDFRLDDEERRQILNLEVQQMSRKGVNPLLLLGAHRALRGGDSVPEYMQKMNAPDPEERPTQ